MSSAKTLNLRSGCLCVTSLSTSNNAICRSKQLHFDPGKMAVMVRSGSATTSFELHSSLVLKVPAQHSQDLPWEAEVRRPSPHHRETDPLEGLRQVQNQGHCSQIFFSCSVFEPLHLHQNVPNCSLSSSISAASQSARYFCCHFASSMPSALPTNVWRERNPPLTRNILRYQEAQCRAGTLRPFSSLFHLFQEIQNFTSRFFCQDQGNFWVEAIASHSCFRLVPSRNFF